MHEGTAVRVLTGRQLGEEEPATTDPMVQRTVRRRIGDVDTGAENGRRTTTGFERSSVRNAIDPAGHAADDACARARQHGRELAGDPLAVRCRSARADYRDEWRSECIESADRPQLLWWVG